MQSTWGRNFLTLTCFLTNLPKRMTGTTEMKKFFAECKLDLSIMETVRSSTHQNLHFVLVPWLAQGHMIPMIDIARLLARRGITVSLITTPANLSRIKPTTDRISQSKLPIHFIPFTFPSSEFGLPDGCENLDSLPSRSLIPNFSNASKMLKQPLIDYLRGPETPDPSCIISDFLHTWTVDVAHEFSVPRFIFQGYNCFAILCLENLTRHKSHETVSSDSEPFVLPGLPQQIEITRMQLPRQLQASRQFQEIYEEIRQSELGADGIVINSFDELAAGYSELLEKSTGKKVWMIGPVSLCNEGSEDMAERGRKTSIDETKCRSWLDSVSPKSVVYVCFGSMSSLAPARLVELGSGLLASNRPFIWVIKSLQNPEVENWLSENFSDESKCIVIRGWAPQAMILSHVALGGFMTHCGWNSTLEGVCAGLPLLTWPMFAEQFLNERLIVEVLKIGVPVGVSKPTEWAAGDAKDEVVLGREEIAKAVERLMDDGEEAEGRRRTAKEYAVTAKKAVEEGGSSAVSLKMLIQYASNYKDR